MKPHEIIMMFEKKIKLNDDESKELDVIDVSNNDQFFGLQIQDNFYLIDLNGKTLLHVEAFLFNCCFSNNSKYIAVYFQKFAQYLLLYDLRMKKKKWAKQIYYRLNPPCQYIIGLNFNNQNEIIILTYEAIQIVQLDGEIKNIIFLTNKLERLNICEKLIKLNDQILIFREQLINLDIIYTMIPIQSSKNLRRIKFQQNAQIIKVSQHLILEFPCKQPFEYKYRELFQSKIIRKNKLQDKDYQIRSKSIINNNLYLFGKKYSKNRVTEVSLITGNTKLLNLFYFNRNPLSNIREKWPLYFIDVINREIEFEKYRYIVMYHLKIQKFIA